MDSRRAKEEKKEKRATHLQSEKEEVKKEGEKGFICLVFIRLKPFPKEILSIKNAMGK